MAAGLGVAVAWGVSPGFSVAVGVGGAWGVSPGVTAVVGVAAGTVGVADVPPHAIPTKRRTGNITVRAHQRSFMIDLLTMNPN